MAQTVGQHGVAAFTSPVNGDPLNATVVVANDNTTRGAYVDHDSDPDIHVQSSLLAARPAAGTVGRKWMTTDSGAVKLWFDTGSAWSEIAYLPSAGGTVAGNVSITGTLGVTGVLTATGGVVGAVTGNASTATALQTARAINGVNFDGTAAITVTAAAGTLTGATLASNVLASSLTSVGTLAGLTVTAPITGSVTGSSGSTTGNAATATALQTARTINGTSFDGTANVTVTAAAGTLTGATLASGVTASSLTSVGTLAALTVTAPITGSVTGSSGSTTGNAATATALQTGRAINGVTFDGTAPITVTAAAGTLSGATLASGVTASSLTSVGTLTGLTVTNPIVGSVTGSSGSTTGNAATATALQTARAINGTNFDGTAAITVTAAAGTLTGATLASNVLASSLTSVGTLAGLTVTAPITGSVTGSSGSTTGNAATATALQTARTINGTSFDGTANITVTAAAGTLTGATLASGVTASSLTSVGTLTSLAVSGTGSFGGLLTLTNVGQVISMSGSGTTHNFIAGANTGGSFRFGMEGSAGGVLLTSAPAYASIFGTMNATSLALGTNGATRAVIDSSGNLGLGVTPSAWASSRALDFGGSHSSIRGSLASVANTQSLVANAYYDGAWKYAFGYNAQRYTIGDGSHSWHIAPSGTANAAISWTQAMTLDASGNLGIGTSSPATTLHVDASGGGVIRVSRISAGAGVAQIESDGTDATFSATNVLKLSTASTERARITGGGDFLVNTTDSGETTGVGFKLVASATAPTLRTVINTATSAFTPITLYNTNATNNGYRFYVKTDGGIANYQANDVNLSDERAKTDIKPVGSYWDKLKAIEIVTFKYKDQSHDDDNIGVIAQQVEAVAPEFIDVDGFGETPEGEEPLKTVYTTDLYHASIKALQEAMTRIETLETRLTALEAA